MPNSKKLLDKATRNPQNLNYIELVRLVEALGFVKTRQTGSHALYKLRDNPAVTLNIQPQGNRAKPYQVRDLLQKVRVYNLSSDE